MKNIKNYTREKSSDPGKTFYKKKKVSVFIFPPTH